MRYVADKAIEGLNVEKVTKLEGIIRDPVSSVQGRMRLQAADLWHYVIRLLLRKKLSAKLKSETQGRLRTSKPMTELVGILGELRINPMREEPALLHQLWWWHLHLLLKKGGKSMVNGYENATCMYGGTKWCGCG